ncbi:hypothetical protein ACPPVO_52880 [Dactylosporangium sp. McL0621]|uniref:hypothetical protein n=1 Tax=Dactylosporangium sp. McL0621 TaxID=3415678 RepID=UPI003CF58205
MAEVLWRMPQPGERPEAILQESLTVADVAEALERPGELTLRVRLDELILAVVAPAGPGLAALLLRRGDDSFIWVVLRARLAGAGEIVQWNQRNGAQ